MVWNVLGEFVSPKNMTQGSKSPKLVLKAPFSWSPSLIRTLLYPHRMSSLVNKVVTITPYLSRDTTYCYRHCKGISRFPLLRYHPSPRPMPDRITSASLTFLHVITPYRTHASNPPSRILPHGQPRSFDIAIPFPLTSS